MTRWQRQSQEDNNCKHFFSGKFNYTKKVHDELSFDEIIFIYKDLKAFVETENGISCFQIYQDIDNPERTLFFIDVPELNTSNLLFNCEFI